MTLKAEYKLPDGRHVVTGWEWLDPTHALADCEPRLQPRMRAVVRLYSYAPRALFPRLSEVVWRCPHVHHGRPFDCPLLLDAFNAQCDHISSSATARADRGV